MRRHAAMMIVPANARAFVVLFRDEYAANIFFDEVELGIAGRQSTKARRGRRRRFGFLKAKILPPY